MGNNTGNSQFHDNSEKLFKCEREEVRTLTTGNKTAKHIHYYPVYILPHTAIVRLQLGSLILLLAL